LAGLGQVITPRWLDQQALLDQPLSQRHGRHQVRGVCAGHQEVQDVLAQARLAAGQQGGGAKFVTDGRQSERLLLLRLLSHRPLVILAAHACLLLLLLDGDRHRQLAHLQTAVHDQIKLVTQLVFGEDGLVGLVRSTGEHE
jgi:hypothetical protein